MPKTLDPKTNGKAARERLGWISHVVPEDRFHARMAEVAAEHGKDISEMLFADLTDFAAVDLIAEFDRPGCWIARQSDGYDHVRVDVGVILPSGDYLTLTVTGPSSGKYADKVGGINWPGCGTKTAADAAAFGAAVAFAAGVHATLAPVAK